MGVVNGVGPGAGPQPMEGGGSVVRAPQQEQLHFSDRMIDPNDSSKIRITVTGSGGSFIVTIEPKNASDERIKEFAKQLFYLAVAHNVSETKTISYKQANPGNQGSLTIHKQGISKSYQFDDLSTHFQERKLKLENKKADAELLRNPTPNAPNPALSIETPDTKIPKRKTQLDEAFTQKIEKVATALAFFAGTERRVNLQVEEEPQADPLDELKEKLIDQGYKLGEHPNFDDLIERTKNLSKDSDFNEGEKQELLAIYQSIPEGYESYKINIVSSLLSHALKNEPGRPFNDESIELISSAVKKSYSGEELSPEEAGPLKDFLKHALDSPSDDVKMILYDLKKAGFE